MLEEMRQSGSTRPLVLRSHVIPDAHGDEWHPAILVDDDVEAVGERLFGECQVHGGSQKARKLESWEAKSLSFRASRLRGSEPFSTHRRQRNRATGVGRDRHLLRDAFGEREERARGRRVRRADDDRHAGVTAAPYRFVEWNAAEEWYRELLGQTLAAALAEQIGFSSALGADEVAHVFDN